MQRNPTFPVMERGKGRAGSKYESAAVIDWLAKREVNNLLGDAGSIDIEEAKRRKLAAEAAMAETELDQVRGTLVPADKVEAEWSELVANCRAKLLSIPTKVAAEAYSAQNVAEMKDTLKRAIIEALNELSESSADSGQGDERVQATA